MTHKVENKNSFTLMGWKRHMTCYSEIEGMETEWDNHNAKRNLYRVELPASDMGKSEGFVYAIGWLTGHTESLTGYETISIPGGRYAVFPVPEENLDDVGDFKGMIHEYITSSEYGYAGVEIEHVKTDNQIDVWFLING